MSASRSARALVVVVGLLAPAAIVNQPAVAAPVTSSATYTVKNGDSLGGIARRLGVVLADLLSANGLTLTSTIHPGDLLVVPGVAPAAATTTTPTPAAPLAYVVVAGDFLFGVAKKLGVTVPALLAANSLTIASVITPGQALAVPAGGRLPAPAVATDATTTAAPTTAAPPTTDAPTMRNYTVLSGDYLAGIARKHGVTLPALLAANEFDVSSVILPGMVLDVPPATLPIAGSAATVTGSSIDVVVTFLRAQAGKPYKFNADGPEAFDCSGLVTAAYELIGVDLPHQSLMQSTHGTAVDVRTQPLLPGDLIFQYSSASPTTIGHVGIVVDATHWIQAAGSGVPVSIGPIPAAGRIVAVRRIVQP